MGILKGDKKREWNRISETIMTGFPQINETPNHSPGSSKNPKHGKCQKKPVSRQHHFQTTKNQR